MSKGFFGIAIYHPKHEVNVGTLYRHAYIMGCNFVATIGTRIKRQASDTTKCERHIPHYRFRTFEDFAQNVPSNSLLVGVELTEDAIPLTRFAHPNRAVYLLGAEDGGIPPKILARCQKVVKIPHMTVSMNMAVAGTIVLYDRLLKEKGESMNVLQRNSSNHQRLDDDRPCPPEISRADFALLQGADSEGE